MANKTTLYRVCTTDSDHRHYFTTVNPNPLNPPNAVFSWAYDARNAVKLTRDEACKFADKCGEYLTGYSEDAARCARSIRVVPASGGTDIAYRYRPAKQSA